MNENMKDIGRIGLKTGGQILAGFIIIVIISVIIVVPPAGLIFFLLNMGVATEEFFASIWIVLVGIWSLFLFVFGSLFYTNWIYREFRNGE